VGGSADKKDDQKHTRAQRRADMHAHRPLTRALDRRLRQSVAQHNSPIPAKSLEVGRAGSSCHRQPV
jgi:hypothetical protein